MRTRLKWLSLVLAVIFVIILVLKAGDLLTSKTLTPKVLIITMFQNPPDASPGEARTWLEQDKLDYKLEIPGSFSPVYYNRQKDQALVITGMGKANATATLMALGLSDKLDLRKTYFIVAGIAGTPPKKATIGTVAWAQWVVDTDLAHEIDLRLLPQDWKYPYFHLGASQPWAPGWTTGTEVYQLNPKLQDIAYQLTRNLQLADSLKAQEYRKLYPYPAAQQAPKVVKGDSVTSDTYWHGTLFSDWATWWVQKFTNGQGSYYMTAMEDNAILTALHRLAAAGKIDVDRIMVLRAAANFDQTYPLGSDVVSLNADTGGYLIAVHNAYLVGSTMVKHIISHWSEFK